MSEVAVLLYITLNRRNINRTIVRIIITALLAALFCLWAVSARNTHSAAVSNGDVSPSEKSPEPLAFTIISTADISAESASRSGSQPENDSLPANISLYPFSINQSISLPVQNAFISSDFGYRDHPVNGRYTFHSGLDLAAPEGTDISAMLDGVVITAKNASDYGNYVVLDHGTFQTLYAHCLRLCVSEGDTVTRGQKIAEVGSTGRATGSHLHVEFRCDGKRYDPAAVLGSSYS